MYYIYVDNGKLDGCGEAQCLDDNVINAQVSEEVYNDYANNRDKYIYANGEIVINPDYAEIEKEKQKEAQRELLLLQIDDLDKKRIRAVCEPSVKDETTGETWLDYYNSEIQKLREQLKELS